MIGWKGWKIGEIWEVTQSLNIAGVTQSGMNCDKVVFKIWCIMNNVTGKQLTVIRHIL